MGARILTDEENLEFEGRLLLEDFYASAHATTVPDKIAALNNTMFTHAFRITAVDKAGNAMEVTDDIRLAALEAAFINKYEQDEVTFEL